MLIGKIMAIKNQNSKQVRFLKLKTDISNLLFKLIFTEFKTKVKIRL